MPTLLSGACMLSGMPAGSAALAAVEKRLDYWVEERALAASRGDAEHAALCVRFVAEFTAVLETIKASMPSAGIVG
jgi:hypothetical protein